MYINVAYTATENPNLEILTTPIRINNCGYYHIHTTPIIETYHPEGRNDYQLLYIADGKGFFHFKGNSKIVTVEKGNWVLFRPKEPQVYYYYSKDKTEVYWIHFTGSNVEQYLDNYGLPQKENVFFTGVSPDYPLIFNQIIHELKTQRANYEDISKLFIHHIFLTINRHIKEINQSQNETISEILHAVHYFNKNYNNPISIEQYAQANSISVNWFIHSFKKIMNISPMQYIVSLRIDTARGYLEKSNKSINEIANIVGYENSLYFSRLFKNHTGMSPTKYREETKCRS